MVSNTGIFQGNASKLEIPVLIYTHICSNDPLCPLHVSAYLTLARLQNSDALIRKHVEHIPHAQPWKRRQKTVDKCASEEKKGKKQQIQIKNSRNIRPLSFPTFVMGISISPLEETPGSC